MATSVELYSVNYFIETHGDLQKSNICLLK